MKPYSLACVRREPPVAVGVDLDLLERLAGVVGLQLVELLLEQQALLGLDLDVGRRAADAAGRLVHHDARVRQGVPLALGAGREQELAHRGGEAHAHGDDVVGDELHRVVDGHAGVDRAAGRVDVEEDVGLVVLGVEQEHLGADRVGVLVLDLRAEEDDAFLEQPLVDVAVEVLGAEVAGIHAGIHCFTSSTPRRPRRRETRADTPCSLTADVPTRYVVPSASALMRASVVSMPALSSTSCWSMPPRANRGGDLGQDGALAALELAPLGDQGAVAVRLEVVRPGVGGTVDVERETLLGLELGDPAGAWARRSPCAC